MDNNTIECLDNGYVRLVAYGPLEGISSQEGVTPMEETILRAARISYSNDLKIHSLQNDLSLLEYLISMRHTSPFEMVEFVFEIKLPLSTAVHFLRHRTANVNMVSYRYTEPEKEDFYTPKLRLQDTNKRQCSSDEKIDEIKRIGLEMIQAEMDKSVNQLFTNYQKLVDLGVAREVARFYLPNSTYTRMYWKLDLHNLLHFLSLRTASDAQYETRVYANAISDLITPLIPNIIKLFNKHRTYSVTFNSDEIAMLRKLLDVKDGIDVNDVTGNMSKRKKDLFTDKINKIRNAEI